MTHDQVQMTNGLVTKNAGKRDQDFFQWLEKLGAVGSSIWNDQ